MRWHDLLYFSKGERRALTLLLSLIAIAWLVLICTSPILRQTPGEEIPDTVRVQMNPPIPPIREKTTDTPKMNRVIAKRATKSPLKKTDTLFKPYPKAEKYPIGTVIELNSADTTSLKKVPGIGSAFARRIVKYRELLGGFYTVEQLAEVYGIDEERYNAMKSWFKVDLSAIRQLRANYMPAKELACHPYVNYKQAHSIERMVRQKGKLQGWENLSLLEEFTAFDRKRLAAYLSFE